MAPSLKRWSGLSTWKVLNMGNSMNISRCTCGGYVCGCVCVVVGIDDERSWLVSRGGESAYQRPSLAKIDDFLLVRFLVDGFINLR